MWLEYHFKDIMCEVDITTPLDIEPQYKREICEVDYDYEVDISYEDLIDYLAPINFKELSQDFQVGFKTAISHAVVEDLINFGELEDNEDFIYFMTEKYREKAYEKCEDENA